MSPSIGDMPWDAPIAQVPGQVPGGTPAMAATAQQELAKQSAGEEQQRNYGLWDGGQRLAGTLHNLNNLYNQADSQQLNVFASSLPQQLAGKGAGEIAHLSRVQQIGTGIGNPEIAQKSEIMGDAIDTAQLDAALKRQAYARVSRGGGQTEGNSAGDQTQGSAGRGNIAMIRQMIGTRSDSTLPGLRAKLQQGWNDVFDGMGQAIQNDPKNYTMDAAIRTLSPYGFSRDQIKQGITQRGYPGDLLAAGGVRDLNKSGPVAPAEGPHTGEYIDQPGAAPAPQGNPGRGPPRGNKMRPTIQAGFEGQGTGDVTDRTGKESVEPNTLIPEMPKQVPANRQGQWDRAVQILFQHPESAGEFDKRFSPGMPGMAKRLLSQRPRGFDQ